MPRPHRSSGSSPASGKAKRVYSFVIFHRAYYKAFEKDLPYAVAVIEREEGPRLLSDIAGIAPIRGYHAGCHAAQVQANGLKSAFRLI